MDSIKCTFLDLLTLSYTGFFGISGQRTGGGGQKVPATFCLI